MSEGAPADAQGGVHGGAPDAELAAVVSRLERGGGREVPGLSAPATAARPPAPRLVALNEPLARELGLDPEWLRSPAGLELLVGTAPGLHPRAQRYAGHQFGMYSPLLGDGRALLIGALEAADGELRELHLKGTGPTPLTRAGDGFAALAPMLRELLVGEALHALGIPTTRGLAVVATGRGVRREAMHPGAVLCRVAASHLRVGTFQFAAASEAGAPGRLRALAEEAIARHAPDASDAASPTIALFEHVARAQARLVAQWMLVGFVHGVLNTDNIAISGETLDLGPCAFLDDYDEDRVFSSIDSGGRYRYRNQPAVTSWNLARLGEALLPLIAEELGEGRRDGAPDDAGAIEAATQVLRAFPGEYESAYLAGLAAKLGLEAPDAELSLELIGLLGEEKPDMTRFFRGLADGSARGLVRDLPRFDAWHGRWLAAIPPDSAAKEAAAARMRSANPALIPRSHRVEEALESAEAGELAPFERLLGAVRHPFEERPGHADLREPPPPGAPPAITFCGT